MRKTAIIRIGVFLALAALVMGAKCPKIPDTHDINVILVTEDYFEVLFEARGSLNIDSSFETIDIIQLRDDLEDAGMETDLIEKIRVAKVEYGTVDYYEGVNDRRIVGAQVSIERLDTGASAVIADNVNVDVHPLLGLLVPVPTETAGIAFVNELMADVVDAIKHGGVTEFVVQGHSSGTSTPTTRTSNFDWKVRVYYHVSGGMEVEVPKY
jgi:hypothetical protein